MKKLFIIFCCLFLASTAYALDGMEEAVSHKTTTVYYGEPDNKEIPHSICPKTQMNESCLTCHEAPSFKLKPEKERDPFEKLSAPYGSEWIREGEKDYLYYKLSGIYDHQIIDFFRYAERHNLDHVIIEIMSPGGSLLNAWRIVGIIEQYKQKMIVETRVHGLAASAGFLIFVSGTEGHRLVSKTCELMWHELMIGKWLSIETPSSSEAEAETLRHLQNTANGYIASRSKLTKAEWDEKIKHLEFWANGQEAVDIYGVADGFL